MVQVLPVSQQAANAVEAFEDAFTAAAADGVICAVEVRELLPRLEVTVITVQASNLAYAAGMAVLKGGVGAKRAHDLLLQIDEQSGDTAA